MLQVFLFAVPLCVRASGTKVMFQYFQNCKESFVWDGHVGWHDFGNIEIFELQLQYFTKIMTRKPKIGNLTNITELYPFPQSKKWHDVTSHENQGPIIFSSRK